MTLHEYRTWEVGEGTPPDDVLRDSPQRCTELTTAEQLSLLRFRSGMTIGAVARAVGVSRFWVQQVEAGEGNPQRLVDFWRTRAESGR